MNCRKMEACADIFFLQSRKKSVAINCQCLDLKTHYVKMPGVVLWIESLAQGADLRNFCQEPVVVFGKLCPPLIKFLDAG